MRIQSLRATLAIALGVCGCGTTAAEPDGVVRLVVEPPSVRVTALGDSARFEAFGERIDGSRLPLPAEWSAASPDVMEIDGDGWARGRGFGASVVIARHESLDARASFLVDSDTVAPALRSVSASPTRVSLFQGPAAVELTSVFEDLGSGVGTAIAIFDGPLGAGITGLVTLSSVEEWVEPGGLRVSRFVGILEIPGTVGVGTWVLSGLRADDRSQNTRRWGAEELERAGLAVVVVAGTGG